MTDVVERADTLRRTGAAVLALGASELLGKVATLLMFLILARVLGVAEFGVVSFGLSLGLLLAVAPSLGLDSRLVQLGSSRPDLLDRSYGALVAIRVLLSAAVIAATCAVVVPTMGARSGATVVLLVASGLVDTVTDASRAACGALQRQQFAAVVLVVQRFATLALTAAAVLTTRSVALAALAYLVGTSVGVLGMHVAARRAGARLVVHGSRAEAKLLLEAAPVMGAGAVAAMGVFRIDSALIGVLIGTVAVGVYGAGYRLFETIVFVSWTLSRAYMPVIARRPDDPEHVRTWARRALVVVCAVYLPYGVVIALRGDDVVRLLFGPEYVHHGVLLGLAAAPLLFGITHLGSCVLLALRPDPVVLLASVVALTLNIAMNLVLIPVWGITAAAIATCAAFLVQATILMRALTRITGSIASPRAIGAVLVGSVCAGAVAHAVADVVLAVPASAVTFLVVWAVAGRVLDPGAPGLRSLLRGADA
ncbi:oligosaccharide flippase family protein [Nocardioides panacisoli]|uniref:Polysaccharide biosynthesis protein C-terminal domain-containing protein n=1 Tax=Nocardioides panacisoli TaxID=627624 RepID=A0ABP7IQ55_9ACTN